MRQGKAELRQELEQLTARYHSEGGGQIHYDSRRTTIFCPVCGSRRLVETKTIGWWHLSCLKCGSGRMRAV
jgi:hypothetical protein